MVGGHKYGECKFVLFPKQSTEPGHSLHSRALPAARCPLPLQHPLPALPRIPGRKGGRADFRFPRSALSARAWRSGSAPQQGELNLPCVSLSLIIWMRFIVRNWLMWSWRLRSARICRIVNVLETPERRQRGYRRKVLRLLTQEKACFTWSPSKGPTSVSQFEDCP